MRFPRKASTGADARADANERLEDARAEQRDAAQRREGAGDDSAEVRASADLTGADEQVAAREAWARWAASEA